MTATALPRTVPDDQRPVRAFADISADTIRRAQDGDKEAFGLIYERMHGPLRSFIQHAVHDPELAEELTHDTFERAWRNIGKTDRAVEFKIQGWLYRLATNILIDRKRHDKLVRWTRLEHHTDASSDPDAGARLLIERDPDLLPESAALRGELSTAVAGAIDTLPSAYQRVLFCCGYLDLSYRETAEVMGVTITSVKSLLFRARLKLRPQLEAWAA